MHRCARLLTGQLRDLARASLDQQGIAVKRLLWMGRHTNHLFRCDTADGERLVVRVCPPGGRSDAELDAELAWLAAADDIPEDLHQVLLNGYQTVRPLPPAMKSTRPRCWPPAVSTSPSGTSPTACQTKATSGQLRAFTSG